MYTYSPEVLGVVASVVTALLSLIPALGKNDKRRNILVIVALLIASFASTGFTFTTWSDFADVFVKAALASLLAYKMFIQNFLLVPAQKKIKNSN